jgi:asparagine synthase (glutamine-hydrolysing)
MCGIAGVVLRDRGAPVDRGALDRMTDVLEHRGPDDRGVEIYRNVGLGNRRLAIIDQPGGHQPMQSSGGQIWITFNGELYNYVELRRELQSAGYSLRSHSDTEVIMGLYEVYGVDGMFERMNGMFAFALHDRREGRLLLARDRFGEKPLYYYRDDQRFAFASEIKAILQLPGVTAEPDAEALHEYLTFQYCLDDATLFRNVRRLRPASYMLLDEAGDVIDEQEYWHLGFEEVHDRSEQSFSEELRATLEDSVRIRLRSDVPVGTYLSGGIDSGIVSSLSAKSVGRGLPAFTGYFAEEGYSELQYATDVAMQNGSELFTICPSPDDFAKTIQRIVYYMDEPAAGPGAFPQFMVSQLARQHVTVVLGGQGGDEIFGGYARYLMMYVEESLKGAIQESQDPQRHLVTLQSALPNLSILQGYVPLLQRFWSSGLFGPMEERYFSLMNRSPHLEAHFTRDFLSSRRDVEMYESFERQFNDILTKVPSGASSLFNRMTSYDVKTLLQSLLHVEDRMSMASSLESRLPLLDHRIAELMFQMPPRFKYTDGKSKAALLAAVGDTLPASVRERKDKMGFPVPFVEWARGELRDFIGDILLGETASRRGLYRKEGLEQLLRGESLYGRELWGLLSLELWFQTFIDGEMPVSGAQPPATVSA